MAIWFLEVIDSDSRHWEASKYKGNLLVRAQDELHARRLAARKYKIATALSKGKKVPFNPWDKAVLVRCKVIDEYEYPEGGPDGVISELGKLSP